MIKVTYLEHSGFVLEYREVALVFDYYKGQMPEFSKEQSIYVFSSHAHYDHFQKSIFDMAKKYDKIQYILSDDIKKAGPEGKTTYVGENQEIAVGELKVKTFHSTDEGVAFLVYLRDKVIYHAGDLNWWHWEEETPEYNADMKRDYQREIAKLADVPIDVAFVLLDSRQEEQYFWGMDYFMKHTDTKAVFPMHMWGYEGYDRLMENPVAADYKDKVMHVTTPGQTFEL